MAYDVLITGGTVVDGTGADARPASVAVEGDRIVAVGPPDDVDGEARRRIDADGRLVTPGFVDVHTHLDAQLMWDPIGSSSCWHGVTSVVLGNCGVTFAPVRPADHDFLAEMMESVEDIPAASILDGLPWDWETYGEYLDSLGRVGLGVNAGGLVGHCALRWYAMGERSLGDERPSSDELALMVDLVDEAVAAGALGVSTSRTLRHRVPGGRHVPGTWAEGSELVALSGPLGRHQRGIMEVAPRFDGDGPAAPRVKAELAWMEQVSMSSGRPVTFNLTQTSEQGDHWRVAIEMARAANERGATIRPQTTARGIGVIFGLWAMTPFDGCEPWRAALAGKSMPERLAVLSDSATADPLIAAVEAYDGPAAEMLERLFLLTPQSGANYAPDASRSLAAEADRRDVSVARAFVELCRETDGRVILNWPLLNHDFAVIEEMISDPVVLMGLADSGAHVRQIMDASQPTWLLTHWVRERGALSIEAAIRRLTSDTARFVGLADRGVLKPGAKADLNVVDWDALDLALPELVNDFPGGAGRFVQRAAGYDTTIVNGEVFMEGGEHTGAFAGQVLRSGPDRR